MFLSLAVHMNFFSCGFCFLQKVDHLAGYIVQKGVKCQKLV